ncbi:EAL domain-containing protein [Cohnella panacarvi]|uniref:EAL domain-containing protein n=1 Tax=Cohnella panacarvi TaxID=400776 RepID=UPI0004B33E62|nr:EAL domain-containing protein [Cohnella panacarvi]
MHLHATYNYSLVFLSCLIAVSASYAALDLTGRVSAAKAFKNRIVWLLCGALLIGTGIWSMHFVGMLAVTLSEPITYHMNWIVVSYIVAIAASAIALQAVSVARLSLKRHLSGALLLGTGIAAMHYSGMAAMHVQIRYDPFWFALSVLIAMAASYVALAFAFHFRSANSWISVLYKLGGGVLMGAAIAGMHYTGMIAAHFEMNAHSEVAGVGMNQEMLAYFVAASTFVAMAIAIAVSILGHRLSSKDHALYEHNKWYISLYENHTDGIVTIDTKGVIVDVNPAFVNMTGRSAEYFLHQPLIGIIGLFVEEQRGKASLWLIYALKDAQVKRLESAINHVSGHSVNLSAMSVPVTIDDEVKGIYFIFRDITEEKKSKEQIQHLAYHDELTSLPNRRLVNLMLDKAIQRSESSADNFAVLVIDIDRFKLINDLLGHAYGDQFLLQVTDRLRQAAVGMNVTIGRMGGDEFAVICHGDPIESAAVRAAERIIEAVQIPYRLKDNDFYVSASVGIALYPEHGDSVEDLLKKADSAMYDVKRNGKNGYCFYSEQLDENLLGKLELESDLRKAIERNELMLHYQPQINAEQNRIIGVEALLRWTHPDKGLVPPGQFITVAEEAGIIGDIGAWVLREACRQMKQWQTQYGWQVPVSVNLSSQQLLDDRLVDLVAAVLRETELDPAYLELEITESIMMDASRASSILQKLMEMGIRFSLDDFGTGYSSLSYLRMFPIERLKIDRTFVQEITTNEDDRAIVETIISMAHHLKMNVIAEGVETKEQLQLLLDNGCDEIQGYYYSKPLAAEELVRYVADNLDERPMNDSLG